MIVATIRLPLRLVIPCIVAMVPIGCDGGSPPPPTPPPPPLSTGAEAQQGKSRKAVPRGVEEFDDIKERRAKNRTKSVPNS